MPYQQPSTALRFRDLQTRVAEYLGVADYGADAMEEAMPPTVKHDLDLVKRIVNDGYRRFIANTRDPETKRVHLWTFLNQYFELELSSTVDDRHVDGDIGRYWMPWWFNGVCIRDWQFNSDSYSYPIRVVSESAIQEGLSITQNTSGPPHHMAFRRVPSFHDQFGRPSQTTTDTASSQTRSLPSQRDSGRRWEAIFWPKPAEALVINTTVRAFPTGLQDNMEFHFAGAEHDRAIEAACLAEAEIKRDDGPGVQEALYMRVLADSVNIDMQAAPRTVGFNLDQSLSADARFSRHPGYTGVDTYNGIIIDNAS